MVTTPQSLGVEAVTPTAATPRKRRQRTQSLSEREPALPSDWPVTTSQSGLDRVDDPSSLEQTGTTGVVSIFDEYLEPVANRGHGSIAVAWSAAIEQGKANPELHVASSAEATPETIPAEIGGSDSEIVLFDPLSVGIRELVRPRSRYARLGIAAESRRRRLDRSTMSTSTERIPKEAVPGPRDVVSAEPETNADAAPARNTSPAFRETPGPSGTSMDNSCPDNSRDVSSRNEQRQGESIQNRTSSNTEGVVHAPRVRLDASGNIVLDEHSMLVPALDVPHSTIASGGPCSVDKHVSDATTETHETGRADDPNAINVDRQRNAQTHRRALRAEQNRQATQAAAAQAGSSTNGYSPGELEVSGRRRETATSASFVSRASCERWPPEETELFYRALRAFGQNYSMIEHLFPNRNRKQIKNKFKKEERSHPARIEAALREHGVRRHDPNAQIPPMTTNSSDDGTPSNTLVGGTARDAVSSDEQIFPGFDNEFIQRVFGAAAAAAAATHGDKESE